MKSPIVLLRSLLIDFKRLESSVNGFERDIITLEGRFKHEGYGFLAITLPILGKSLQQGLSKGRFSCPPNFSKIRGGTIPKLFQGMFSEVFEPVSGLVKEDLNFGTLKNLYQILFLFKKTHLTSECNDKLHKEAVRTFFECDLLAHQVELPDRESIRIRYASQFILQKLRLNNFSDILCKHGPGAVKERLKANQKWLAVTEWVKQSSSGTDLLGYDLFAIDSRSPLSGEFESESISPSKLQSFDYGSSRSTARLVSVPKDSSSNRTITVEPVLNQFIQQGLNTTLRDNIKECSILNRCLALSDQSKNQILALEGSRTGRWATIDLKSASDLMSLKLVKLVFGSHEEFLRHALDCRTEFVQSDVSDVRLGKFAGMGNALTFPVQSVVFAVIAITAILDSWRKSTTRKNLERAARHVRVYGDDIIVDAKHAHYVVHWLESFGLKTNLSKSFLVGNFKESCGVDAYMGVDITPIYLKPRPDNSSKDPNDIGSLVSFANQCWLAGLYKTAHLIENEVEERLGYRLPLVSRSSGALGWHSRIDASHANSWCDKLHTLLVRAPVIKSKVRPDYLDGYAALMKFFHVPLIGRPLNHLRQTSLRFQLRISRKRVPVRLTENSQVLSH
jgi:hypothetical protein